MEDNRLVVTDENGLEIVIEVIDILGITYQNVSKEYVIYKLVGNKNMFIAILEENEDSYSINKIDSKEEYAYVLSLINKNIVGDSNE